jgi:hypothetical protein
VLGARFAASLNGLLTKVWVVKGGLDLQRSTKRMRRESLQGTTRSMVFRGNPFGLRNLCVVVWCSEWTFCVDTTGGAQRLFSYRLMFVR